VTLRRGALALTLAALLVALSACSATGIPPVSGSGGASAPATSTAATGTVEASEPVAPIAPDGGSPADAKALDTQLDAMQRELDALKMPADGDFGDAENALY